MTLDPQVATLLARMVELGIPEPWQETPEDARATYRETSRQRAGASPPVQVGAVRNGTLAGVPVRVYEPQERRSVPTVAYFHGGGWVIGDLDTHDPVCRLVCDRLGAVVVSVDYRQAPEHRYPAALDDCLAVTSVLAAEGPVAVAGDSAGGTLATGVALRGLPVRAQLLFVPALDATMSSPSCAENAVGLGLTARSMRWYWDHYAAPSRDEYASPLSADPPPDLAGQPPAVVVTAGYDPLRDEGDAWAVRLAAAGVSVTHLPNPTLVHGFLPMFGVVDAAAAAVVAALAAFGRVLDRGVAS